MEIDDSVAHTGDKSLKIVGIAATGVASHTKLQRDSIPAEDGQTFTIAFWAKVDAKEGGSREVDVSAQMEHDPWPGFYRKTIVLDSINWKEYTHTFVVEADEAGGIWVGLSVAQSDVDFWIDDFRLFEAESSIVRTGKSLTSWGRIKRGY